MASLPVGQCIPITPGRNNMTSRLNEPMSHFLSLEIQKNKLLEIFLENSMYYKRTWHKSQTLVSLLKLHLST